jgi:hypothetical protein
MGVIQSKQSNSREFQLLNKTLSILQANRLYLAILLLVVSLGALLQSLSLTWGLLITEFGIILLPTLWLLRHNKINIRESSGLKKPRASLLLVAGMLGSGAWLVTSLVEILMVQISGYAVPTPVGMIPTTPFQAVLLFIGLVIAAPICEEILFRGTIQPAYQNHTSGGIAILVTSLMFALFHLRFQGLPALLILSFLLGFTYWRTQSLTITMVLHAATNFLAAIVIIRAGLFPTIELPIPSLPAGAFGVMMLVVGLVLLQRFLPRPQIYQQEKSKKLFSWQTLWPILLAGLLFIVVAFQEVSAGVRQSALHFQSQNLPVSAQWTYEIRHKGGVPIGIAKCQWHMGEEFTNLSCQREHEGFEYRSGNSYFSSLAGTSTMNVEWQTENLNLVSLTQHNLFDTFQSDWKISSVGEDLQLNLQTQNEIYDPITFPPTTLVQEEWGWRLMGFSFGDGTSYSIDYLNPLTWRENTQDSGPLLENDRLTIKGPERIIVPAGEFDAWKIILGKGQTAWYSVEEPSILLRFDATMFDFLLIEAE